jgi:hypothetical protein
MRQSGGLRRMRTLETTAKLLKLLERFQLFSKCPLKSLNNQTDFDSAIRRFDPRARPTISRLNQ